MNLAAWLERSGRTHGDRPAVAVGANAVQSYAELSDRAARLAAGLRGRLSLQAGDRVAVCAKNCAAYVEALFGVWHGGLAAVPMNAKLHGAELAYILDDAEARVCLAGPEIAEAIAAHQPACVERLIVFDEPGYESLFESAPIPLATVESDDLAWLFYTSGTTGRPKGAMLSHRNIEAMSRAYLTAVDPTAPGDAILHAAPMSHGSGLYMAPHVTAAAVNVIPESGGFHPAEICALAKRWPGASMFAAPTMVKRLVDHIGDCGDGRPTFRTITYGGGPMYVADARAALDCLGPCLAQIYGQGESPMTITILDRRTVADRDHPRWLERLGSVGVVNPAVEVRIAGAGDDADDTPLAAGETGEILVRGDAVMAGYWRNPEATAETLRGGWLHTGDLGAFDADGFLTLKDRAKDVIISGGANIYPREVEELLLTDAGVEEVSVIGRPDPEWGEIVVAYVVGAATAADLDALCLDNIARFKRPKAYVHIDALPKNNYGKILKTSLRAIDVTVRHS